MRIITPTQLDSKLNGKETLTLIDVSEEEDFDPESFGNAQNIAYSKFNGSKPPELEDIDEYDEIVLLCDDSTLAKLAAQKMKAYGYTKVYVLEGGIQNWYAQGYE